MNEAPPLPLAFLERMTTLLGDEFAAFQESYAAPPAVGLRVNTLKISPADFAAQAPFALSPLHGIPEGFLVTDDSRPGKHPYYAAGLYYLQDPAAMTAAVLAAPQPGELVLDLAAAPGGKATTLAARMQGQGVLVANEVVRPRAWDLAENLERWGATNVLIMNEAPERLAEQWPGLFDRVVLDAPCSGEGMFRKLPAAREEWSPELVAGCALRQRGILATAARLVRPGGLLVYITCTFAPEENEAVVAQFLDEHPHFHLEALPSLPCTRPGRPEWIPEPLRRPELVHTVRLWPQHGAGEGHFVALLRHEDTAGDEPTAPLQAPALPAPRKSEAQLYEAFCRETFGGPIHHGHLAQVGSYLYDVPAAAPDPAGLRAIHPGRWLGVLKKNRFEPAHALALSIPAGVVRQRLDLPADDPRLSAYLRGLTVADPGEDGWTLVTVDGHPLGWGKRVRGVLKNHYPRGLRRPA